MTYDVRVNLAERSYDILVDRGLLQTTGEVLKSLRLAQENPIFVICDSNVADVGYLQPVLQSLSKEGYTSSYAIVPAGEATKSLEWASYLYDQMFDARLDRKSVVVALGGGVVGDLSGFVAATYMRGIDFVQIPTTILAHDSAVGGKVAVNHPKGKNMIGAFHQPRAVIYDVDTLQSLPSREVRSGLAEVIKHSLIWDASFLEWLEGHIDDVLKVNPAVMTPLLSRSCAIKAEVVSKDEKENDIRAFLNFGHTLGHAIEGLSGYGTFTHGEAIAIGMAFATELSVEMADLEVSTIKRVEDILVKTGLPIHIPSDLDENALIDSMLHDKKSTGGCLTFVLLRSIGDVFIEKDVPIDVIVNLIKKRRGTL